MTSAVRITSYNVLADAYASRSLYPSIPTSLIAWEQRQSALIKRLNALDSDIVCLQEVQATHWPNLEQRCASIGLHGVFAQKGQSRVDGCALLFKTANVRLISSTALYFADGAAATDAPSGHLALCGHFATSLGPLLVANTHLRWQKPCADAESHIGYRQTRQLIACCTTPALLAMPSVVCGDFNVTADHALVRLFISHGFQDAYAADPQPTCAPNQRHARIDFIFASRTLAANSERLPVMHDGTTLPNASEPSDHLPITARLSSSAGSST